MRTSTPDLLLTASAPAIWGSTYIVTTEFLPGFDPMAVALLRALPAGLLLLLIARRLPTGIWWLRSLVLGALNISIFLSLLFVAAYRLPGGVAATVGAIQPLIVALIAPALLATRPRMASLLAGLAGIAGVGLLVLGPGADLDGLGIAAGLAGAVSMALGNVLARKWQAQVPMLTMTAWQLCLGGLLLVPVVLVSGPALPAPTAGNLLGLAWLSLVGAALTYALWFRGIGRLSPVAVSSLLFLSPVTAAILGWLFLDQALSPPQLAGMAIVAASVWLGTRPEKESGAGRAIAFRKIKRADGQSSSS
ncbi:EamA family transporter [uncultured Castellaniella sp.]|uniref:EamA family transporter n=1 Tax=uncultured Castellaniella sp. TaxID=647907 RepID=UPI00260C6EF9|nr:EamA family transporter [uncultured Castellaniella sp.]